ncbi:MAG: cation transporter, partial [Rhizobiales bacterium]|nr:cation transporter [Hyphomicrobiales bacterium]
DNIDLEQVYRALGQLPGVSDVHDLHVWSLTGGRVAMTAHLVAPQGEGGGDRLLEMARSLLHERFDVDHVTIQIETSPCPDAATHRFTIFATVRDQARLPGCATSIADHAVDRLD